MKDCPRQKSKYLPPVAAWATSHGGLPRDIITISIEFEEKVCFLRNDPEALKAFQGESKLRNRVEKIIAEGPLISPSLSIKNHGDHLTKIKQVFTKPGLQYYFTAGVNVIRCYTISKGCLAPQAAGAIHADFKRGFFRLRSLLMRTS